MKIYNKFLVGLLGLMLMMGACKKDPKEEIGKRTLDANFSFVIKPDPGAELVVNLYYMEQENEPFYERQADVVLRHTLSAPDIESGFTLTFDDLKESPFAYVTAYVDVDGDKELSEGDIAYAYLEHSLRSVLKGFDKADNVSHRQFMTIEMVERYSTVVSFEADFTFAIAPAEGTELFLNFYYADQQELDYYQRAPDEVRPVTLTATDIKDGVTISLDDMQDRAYIYATAYLDIDGNGELNHGDIAAVYNGKSMMDILEGKVVADNIAGKERVALTMEEWFINENGQVKDIDGNIYTTVIVGDKEWMVENLKVTRYRNGAQIPTGLSNADWANTFNAGRVGAYAVYPYTESGGTVQSEEQMIAEYGFLYNGYTVEDVRELAPVGWRVATDEDFKALEQEAGMAEELLDGIQWRGTTALSLDVSSKLRSTAGWPAVGTDDFGFKALPAGVRAPAGTYSNFFNANTLARAVFWTSTPDPSSNNLGYRRIFESSRPHSILRGVVAKREGYSIRCVRDR